MEQISPVTFPTRHTRSSERLNHWPQTTLTVRGRLVFESGSSSRQNLKVMDKAAPQVPRHLIEVPSSHRDGEEPFLRAAGSPPNCHSAGTSIRGEDSMQI